MTTAPILPFRLRKKITQYEWTGATESVLDEAHGLIRLDEVQIVIETTRCRRIRKMSALGSINTTYENFSAEQRTIPLSDIVGVSLRVPTWNFWSAPRVVFHVREMRVLEGVPGADAAEFSVPVILRDRAIASAFVGQCLQVLSSSRQSLPNGTTALPGI